MLTTFSIPYRIELAVTAVSVNRPVRLYQPFSIPYRIELAVTCEYCGGIFEMYKLSVSPIGSNSL